MDEKRDSNGFIFLQKAKSQDSVSSSGRRRGSSVGSSFGTNWFKKLSSKISNSESDISAQRRRSSAGSISTTGSPEAETGIDAANSGPNQVSRTQSFKDGFRRKNSAIPPVPQTVSGSNGSPSPKSNSPTLVSPHGSRKNSVVQEGPDAKRGSLPEVEGVSGSKRESVPLGPSSLADLKKRKITTKSVGFALSTFSDNPPQRIPPVNPTEGNIDFLPNGEVVVRKRSRSFYNPETQSYVERNHAEVARISQVKALQNAERLHASITTNPLASLFHSGKTNGGASAAQNSHLGEYEEPASMVIAGRDVDGTAHVKHRRNSVSPSQSEVDEESWENRDIPGANAVPPPDQIYTRCCHLREIMPIRNILRQLQGQLAPIPRVRVANTKPTLVEIQAFSDFLTVVPVSSLILDNHILTDEMLRLIFVGIVRSQDIARLTFVNTNLGPLGWQYLCSFLANNRKTLLALNLSCTDPTGVPHRIPTINRREMDWRLLSEALVKMGSLEELDLGGTKIGIDDLNHLVENGFKRGRILGLANNSLTHDDVKFIADWARLPDSQLMGINLSGNDLSREEDWSIVQSFLTNPRIFQLSLRNSKLSHMHASHLVRAISPEQARKSNLRHLDISYNPELFPAIVDRLSAALPNFPYLSRLQIEHCDLDNDTIITICEALSHCHRLVYLSVVGNDQLNESAATALCVAVHLSRSICTVEADINESNQALRQQLAGYCIQNLERNAGNLAGQPKNDPEDDTADISSFHDDLRAVAKEISSQDVPMSEDSSKSVIDRLEDLRNRIKLRMQSLLVKRRSGSLCVRDRESLMRLFFYSTNLDRLKREAVGGKTVQEPTNAEEIVKNVGEEDLKPPLHRQSSRASILSLKKLEREEGESHKAYAEKLMQLDDDSILDAVGKLKVRDLEHIMS